MIYFHDIGHVDNQKISLDQSKLGNTWSQPGALIVCLVYNLFCLFFSKTKLTEEQAIIMLLCNLYFLNLVNLQLDF